MSVFRPLPGAIGAAFSWVIVVAAAWLAVSNQPWALTLLLASVGGLYLLVPPSGLVPRSFLVWVCLLLLLAGTAFAPAAWLGAAFQQPFLDRGIHLPGTVSCQPWWSLEDLTLLVATLLWAWNCFEGRLSVAQRNDLLGCYLFALAVVAFNSIFRGTALWQGLPAFWQELGQFANRNQTGDLLLMGGIASFARGLVQISRKKWRGAWWMVLAGIFFAAIICNGSRAAVGLFALGLLILFLLTPGTRTHRQVTLAAIFVIGVFGVLIFAGAGGELGQHFQDLLIGHEGRWAIYRDAGSMVLRDPCFGVGLGNFEGVYNTMRIHTAQLPFRCLHPESDWLWIAAELGLAGVVVFAFGVMAPFRIYWQKTPCPDLTRISVTLAILFLIHSLFDVGGHRLGTVWNCLYLAGLGAFRTAAPTDIRVSPLFWRGAGLLLLVVASLRFQSASLYPWMPTRASEAAVEAALQRNLPLSEQKDLLDMSLRWDPLDWLLYYQRGSVCLQSPQMAKSSVADFNRVLYLDQNSPDLLQSIADICRHSDLPEALLIQQEVLNCVPVRQKALFTDLYMPSLDQLNSRGVSTLAKGDPGLETSAVVRQHAPEFDTWRQSLLTANPSLTGVPPTLARALFDRWVEVGDVPELIKEWPLHPQWQVPGWRAYAKGLAKVGRYAEAVNVGYRFLPPVQMPQLTTLPSLEDAVSQYQANPQDPYNGVELYLAQSAAGSKQDALNTLMQLAKLPQSPDYVPYLLAKNLHASGQDEAAWQALAPLLDKP